jgi:hypothetical protein
VERRRVYDVVNILSSLGIVRRLQKNTYEVREARQRRRTMRGAKP